jgi:thiamine biosynthesis lipoprotein
VQRRIGQSRKSRSWFLGKWPAAIVLIVTVMMVSVIRHGLNQSQTVEKSEFAMDTVVLIKASGKGAREAVDQAFDEIRSVEALLSSYVPSSDVSRVNAEAGYGYVTVSSDTFWVLERVQEFYWKTGGAFDVTVAPLVRLWGFDSGDYRVPMDEEIQDALRLVGFDKVLMDELQVAVRFKKEGMSVDLGGVGKGYAVDRAYSLLEKQGVDYAFISAGTSSIRVLGTKPGGKLWRVGIGHPRSSGKYLGVVSLRSGDALGTSGDYQKYFEEDGVVYSHIIDPHTGLQPRDLSAVTILARNALDADILSTAVFVLGSAKGMELVESLDGVEAVLFTANGDILVSSGMNGRFELQSGG